MAHGQESPFMGGEQAAKNTFTDTGQRPEEQGQIIDPAVEKKLLDEIKGRL